VCMLRGEWCGVVGGSVVWAWTGGAGAVGRSAIGPRRSESGRYHGLGESAGAVVLLKTLFWTLTEPGLGGESSLCAADF
jgi:hypothetical protein